MLKMTGGQKKLAAWFAVAILLAMYCTSSNIHQRLHLYDLHTYLYSGLVIAWGFLVHQRIVNRQARRYLVLAAAFMLVLFLSRLARWRCFWENAFVAEYAWYAYYVSFVGVPLSAFMAALCVGKEEKDEPLRHARWLWLVLLAFSVIVFTNPWHEWFFRFRDETHEKYSLGPVYYACVGLMALFAIATMVIIIKRCQVATVRKKWMIPFGGMLFFTGLTAWYYALGGSSPELFGIKLYNLQEIFCMLFIFPFESMIQLGIMPNNSRYALFFKNSPIDASILDEAGNIVYASRKQQAPEDDGQTETRQNQQIETDQNMQAEAHPKRRSEKAIRGGKMVWNEDLEAIQRLDEEIQKVTEELEEENELIREENNVRSERIRYETKNRLYDKIADAVREKALAIDAILTELADMSKEEGKAAKNRLIRAMILGAYVKRMGNMMLITEESKEVSTQELVSAIRESLECFALTDSPCDFQSIGERLLPTKLVLLSYELLESLLENEEETYSLLVILNAREKFLFRIMVDAKAIPLDASWKREELAAEGATLSVEFLDDAWRVTLRADESADYGKEGEA